MHSKGSTGAISRSTAGAGLVDDFRQAIREVLRQELPAILAEQRSASTDENLLDLAAAAKRLGIGKSTVRKKARACELPSIPIGRRLLFRPADLDAYAEARRRSPERVKALAKAADHA